MTDLSQTAFPDTKNTIGQRDVEAHRARLKKRYASEARFKFMGLGAILASIAFLIFLLSTFILTGLPAFTYNYISVPVDLTSIDRAELEETIDFNNNRKAGEKAKKLPDFRKPILNSLYQQMPFFSKRKDKKIARQVVTDVSGILLKDSVVENTALAGTKFEYDLPVSDFVDLYLKGLTASNEKTNPDSNLTFSQADDEITITADKDIFGLSLQSIKNILIARSERGNKRIFDIKLALENQLDVVNLNESESAVAKANANIGSLNAELKNETAKYDDLLARSVAAESEEILDTSMPSVLVDANGGTIKLSKISKNSATGTLIIPMTSNDAVGAGDWAMKFIAEAEADRKFKDKEVAALDRLVAEGRISTRFASIFFSNGDSREPEMAGVWGAVVGSFFTMLVTLLLSFPLGVAAAIYLEEFAAKNKITNLIEVNINNLAAVPSIVFGLLGLAVFLNFFELPRSAPVVGGMVLALMTLPVVIIASRTALKSVPPSIREAALGVGASKLQAVFHHVLPLAMPGILTGAIIGMARALGETAPLLMIGMVAFVVDIPGGFTDPSTVLPVQVYLWADAPEPGFQQKTAAAIIVLLGFLILMNAIAVLLRKRFERRW